MIWGLFLLGINITLVHQQTSVIVNSMCASFVTKCTCYCPAFMLIVRANRTMHFQTSARTPDYDYKNTYLILEFCHSRPRFERERKYLECHATHYQIEKVEISKYSWIFEHCVGSCLHYYISRCSCPVVFLHQDHIDLLSCSTSFFPFFFGGGGHRYRTK